MRQIIWLTLYLEEQQKSHHTYSYMAPKLAILFVVAKHLISLFLIVHMVPQL